MKVTPLDGPFGVEISGVTLTELSDHDLADAKALQHEHGVVFFNNMNALTCEQHIEFASRWGDIVINRFFERVDGFEQIAMVRKEPSHSTSIGENWHTDHSYDIEPARGSILVARELPQQGGGTQFINMHLAYEDLSAGLKATLRQLRAVHSSEHSFSYDATTGKSPDEDRYNNPDQATQNSVHPVIISHPDSGLPVLYVNPEFTVRFDGWTEEESAPLLNYLYAHASQPKYVLEYRWKPHGVAFWDNRAVWHRALNDYPGERRLMHRITLEGCALNSY